MSGKPNRDSWRHGGDGVARRLRQGEGRVPMMRRWRRRPSARDRRAVRQLEGRDELDSAAPFLTEPARNDRDDGQGLRGADRGVGVFEVPEAFGYEAADRLFVLERPRRRHEVALLSIPLSRARRKLGWVAQLLAAAEYAQDTNEPHASR